MQLPSPAPNWLSSKESTCNTRDTTDSGSIPGSGRSLGKGNGNPFQYSCLGNSMDRGAWWVTVRGITKGQTKPSYSTHTHTHSSTHASPPFLPIPGLGLPWWSSGLDCTSNARGMGSVLLGQDPTCCVAWPSPKRNPPPITDLHLPSPEHKCILGSKPPSCLEPGTASFVLAPDTEPPPSPLTLSTSHVQQ